MSIGEKNKSMFLFSLHLCPNHLIPFLFHFLFFFLILSSFRVTVEQLLPLLQRQFPLHAKGVHVNEKGITYEVMGKEKVCLIPDDIPSCVYLMYIFFTKVVPLFSPFVSFPSNIQEWEFWMHCFIHSQWMPMVQVNFRTLSAVTSLSEWTFHSTLVWTFSISTFLN